MSDYTPTTEQIREYVETGGEARPWVELDETELARQKARGEAFDRWLEAHEAVAHLGYDPSPGGFPFKNQEKEQMRAALRAAGGFDLAEWDRMLLRGMTSDAALDAALEAFASRDGAHADREDIRAAISAALRAAQGVR